VAARRVPPDPHPHRALSPPRPQIFGNVLETRVLAREDKAGGGARVLMEQKCSWGFALFRGTFMAEIWVEEGRDETTLDFSLKESSFMKGFRGGWALEGAEGGRTRVTHTLAVTPTLQPPPPFRHYTRKIMVQQERQLLADLAVEIGRRATAGLVENLAP